MWDLIDRYLDLKNITVVEKDGITKPFVVEIDNKLYIGIDGSMPDENKKAAIAHELGHIVTNSLYKKNYCEFSINELEYNADCWMVLANRLISTKYDNLQPDLKNKIDRFVGGIIMKNCVNLLCLQNGVDVDTLSLLLGINTDEARNILMERTVIRLDTLKRLSEVFQVSEEYILCQE